MNNVKFIIDDLWYHYVYDDEVEPYLIIYISKNNKDYELAHISMPHTTPEIIDQETTYNFCLEIAHEAGYYLEGEVDSIK